MSTITNDCNDYAVKLKEFFDSQNIRSELDLNSEKLNIKIARHAERKVPYIVIVGKREADQQQITIRKLSSKEQNTYTFENIGEFIKNLQLPL